MGVLVPRCKELCTPGPCSRGSVLSGWKRRILDGCGRTQLGRSVKLKATCSDVWDRDLFGEEVGVEVWRQQRGGVEGGAGS